MKVYSYRITSKLDYRTTSKGKGWTSLQKLLWQLSAWGFLPKSARLVQVRDNEYIYETETSIITIIVKDIPLK